MENMGPLKEKRLSCDLGIKTGRLGSQRIMVKSSEVGYPPLLAESSAANLKPLVQEFYCKYHWRFWAFYVIKYSIWSVR